MSLVEPGTVDTELRHHVRAGIREGVYAQTENMQMLESSDIADTITFIVTRKRHVAVNEVLVLAAEQTW